MSKRYRFTGMERDEETGLQYHSQRYDCPWLGRWDRPDPIGLGDGGNRWAYVKGRVTTGRDEIGLQLVDEGAGFPSGSEHIVVQDRGSGWDRFVDAVVGAWQTVRDVGRGVVAQGAVDRPNFAGLPGLTAAYYGGANWELDQVESTPFQSGRLVMAIEDVRSGVGLFAGGSTAVGLGTAATAASGTAVTNAPGGAKLGAVVTGAVSLRLAAGGAVAAGYGANLAVNGTSALPGILTSLSSSIGGEGGDGTATAHIRTGGRADAGELGEQNSIVEQSSDGGRSVTYYGHQCRRFSREDYGQSRSHRGVSNLPGTSSPVPHEHAWIHDERGLQGKLVRELDEAGRPVTRWKHDR